MSRKATRKTPAQDETKAVRAGFTLPPALMAHAQHAAESSHGGNLSRYLQSLIESDMKGASGAARNSDGSLLQEHVANQLKLDSLAFARFKRECLGAGVVATETDPDFKVSFRGAEMAVPRIVLIDGKPLLMPEAGELRPYESAPYLTPWKPTKK